MAKHPLPDIVKDLKGTNRKDRRNDLQPKFDIVLKIDPPPDWWNKYAKDEYNKLTKALISVGVLQAVDMTAVAMYCLEMGHYYQAQVDISLLENTMVYNERSGLEIPHGLFKLARQSFQSATSLMVKFGLTPADRQRLQIGQPVSMPADPMDDIM